MARYSNSKPIALKLSSAIFAAALVFGFVGEIATVSAEEAGTGTLYHHRHHRHHYHMIYPSYGNYGFDFRADDYGGYFHPQPYYNHKQPCVTGALGSSHPLC